MRKNKQELMFVLRSELEKKLLDDKLSKEEKREIQNLLDVKADSKGDSYYDKSFLGIYENDNPIWYWSFKIVIILGISICLFKIIN